MIIYGLTDPRTSKIRYVGFTSGPLSLRLSGHVSEALVAKGKSYRAKWIRSLSKFGLRPGTIILEKVNSKNWQERERFWIAKLPNLVNGTAGGEGLLNPSPEIRRKIGDAQRGRTLDKSNIEMLVAAQRAMWDSPLGEQRRALRAAKVKLWWDSPAGQEERKRRTIRCLKNDPRPLARGSSATI